MTKPILSILYIGKFPEYFQIINENKNISLITLEDSIQASNYLNSKKTPDAIICDYNLTGNNGLFLFDWIKEHAEYKEIPFILLSKEFNADLYKLSFKKQVNDFYVTSVTPPEYILKRIEFLCANKKTYTTSAQPETNNEV